MRSFNLLAGGAAVLAVVLVGCGNQQQQTTSNNNGGGSDHGSLQALVASMAGKSAEKSSAHMVFRAEAGGQGVEGTGDIRLGNAPAMDMTMALPEQGELSMRLVDDVLYVKTPKEIQPGKPWIKIDPSGTDPVSHELAGGLKQMREAGDPSQLLKQLEGAGQITNKRPEELNGKQTTHYSLTIDVTKVAAQMGPAGMVEQARAAGLSTIPLEVWVDREDLPVRMLMDVSVKDPGNPQAGQVNVKVTMDYSEWGKPVTVTPPPADQVGQPPR